MGEKRLGGFIPGGAGDIVFSEEEALELVGGEQDFLVEQSEKLLPEEVVPDAVVPDVCHLLGFLYVGEVLRDTIFDYFVRSCHLSSPCFERLV